MNIQRALLVMVGEVMLSRCRDDRGKKMARGAEMMWGGRWLAQSRALYSREVVWKLGPDDVPDRVTAKIPGPPWHRLQTNTHLCVSVYSSSTDRARIRSNVPNVTLQSVTSGGTV